MNIIIDAMGGDNAPKEILLGAAAAVREYGVMCNSDWYAPERTVGFGDTNWRDVFYILHRAGYEGDVSIEGYHDNCYRGEWEMTGQLHALHYLKWARGGEFVPTPWEA